MTTLNLTVTANASDTHAGSATNDAGKRPNLGVISDGTLLQPGSHGSNDEYSCAARFTGVTIAPGATISQALFSMVADSTYNAGASVIKYWVCCQAADNAGALATSGSTDLDGSTRAGTTADSTWTQTSVTGGTRYSIDITSAVQEVINRAGWASGNAIVVLVDTHADCTLGEWQDYRAYNHASGGTTGGPHLDITYTTGGGTYTLSGGGTVPAPAGSGTGLTSVSSSTLSGGGTIPAPSGSGTGFAVTNPTYTLSGTATVDPPAGSGTGLTFAVNTFTLSGGGTAPAPTGGGSGLTFTTPAYTLSGSGTVPAPTGSGAGLTYVSLSTLSGGGTAPAPSGSGSGLTFALASDHDVTASDGYTDVSPKQVVRTSANILYAVVSECDAYPYEAGDRLMVYKGDNAGVPTSFTQYIQSGITNVNCVACAIDGSDQIHILYHDRSGNLVWRLWDTGTDTMGSATTVDTGLPTTSDTSAIGQGMQSCALTLDSSGVPHVVYLKSDGSHLRVNYRNRSGGTWSSAATIDDQSFGSNQRCWHPNIATLASGDFLIAWARGAFSGDNDGTIFTRRRTSAGVNQTTANVSGANGARTSIDQSTSLMQTADGTVHITYITSTNDSIRYSYSTDNGDSWTANNPGSGTQVTHNPSLGPDGAGGVRIYGHGTPASPPDGHGDDLYYFAGAGGAATWGSWTRYTTGSFDSSVNTRWAQHFHWFPGTLDVAYWDDTYPNTLHTGTDVVAIDRVLSGGGTIPAPAGSGAGLTYVSSSTLSGGGTIPVAGGSGTGLTFTVPVYTLSGTGTLDAPTGSGTGLTYVSASILSGGGTVDTPAGSGAGLTFTAPIYTLSGTGTVDPPAGSGAGLQFANAIYSLTGGATAPAPAGSGAGLTFTVPVYTLSGTATAPAPAGAGTGLTFVSNTFTLGGGGTVPVAAGSGAGLTFTALPQSPGGVALSARVLHGTAVGATVIGGGAVGATRVGGLTITTGG